MSETLARITLDLVCVCGAATKGCQIVLKKEGSAPVLCPHCGATFDVTFLKDTPTALVINPRDDDNPVRIAQRPKGEPS